MKQQINLYQPMFRRQEKVFSARAMLQISGVLVVLLAAIYGYSWSGLRPFEQELANIEREKTRVEREIARLQAESPPPVKSRLLEEEVQRLSRDLDRMRRVQRAIGDVRFGNLEGFSKFFEGLARQHVPGVWLTRVNLSHGGTRLTLSGRTVSAELVPIYLKRLSDEQAFSGMSFNVLELTRSEDDPSIIEFNVGTDRDDKRRG